MQVFFFMSYQVSETRGLDLAAEWLVGAVRDQVDTELALIVKEEKQEREY